MSVLKQIGKNILSAWTAKLIKLIAAIYLLPFFIQELGKEQYAMIVLFGTILGFSELLDLGLRQSLSRHLTEYLSKSAIKDYNKTFSTGIILYLGLSLIVSLLLVIFAFFFIYTLNLSVVSEAVFFELLLTYGIGVIGIGFIMPVFSAVIVSYNRFDLNNYRNAIFALLTYVFIILALHYTDWGIKGWAYITLGVKLLELLSFMFISKRLNPNLEFSTHLFSLKSAKELFQFGGVVFLSKWTKKIKYDVDPLLISTFLSPLLLPLYRPGTSLVQNSRPLISAFAGQLSVVATDAHVSNKNGRLQRILLDGTRITLLLSIPFLTLFLVFGEELLQIWLRHVLDATELRVAYGILVCWALIDFFYYIEGSSYSVLFAMKNLKHMVQVDFVLAIFNITASVLLLIYSNLGIFSVLLPGIVIEFFARFYFLFYTNQQLGLSVKKMIQNTLMPGLFVAAVTIMITLSFTSLLAVYTQLYALFLQIMLMGIVWIVTTYFIGLNTIEKEFVQLNFQKIWNGKN